MPIDEIDFGAALNPEADPGPLIPEILEETENLPALAKFSTQEVAVRLLEYEKKIAQMEKEARAFTIIKDESTNLQVAEIGQRAKKEYKILDAMEEYFKRPHLDYVQAVRNLFSIKGRYSAIDKNMGRLESAYSRLKENERRIKEAEAKKAAQELEAKLAAEAKEAAAKGIEYESVTVVAPIIPEEPKVTRTAEGSSSQRKKWTCTIIDPAQVPREYCTPDPKLLNDAVKGGIRVIAGCEIDEESTTVRRV